MILLDSSFLIAYYSIKDKHHDDAVAIMPQITNREFGDVFITDYIFDEIVTVIAMRSKRIAASIRIGAAIKEALNFFHTSEETFDSAWELYRSQKSTTLSFTDCTIVEMIRGVGLACSLRLTAILIL
jgi:predicted nucleic acid-binding protein